jgi:hypothetical protein
VYGLPEGQSLAEAVQRLLLLTLRIVKGTQVVQRHSLTSKVADGLHKRQRLMLRIDRFY